MQKLALDRYTALSFIGVSIETQKCDFLGWLGNIKEVSLVFSQRLGDESFFTYVNSNATEQSLLVSSFEAILSR